jgi:hypothetical protein
VAIAGATLTPSAPLYDPPPSTCPLCGVDSGADAVANVLLFLPFGAGLAASGIRARRALPLVAAATLAIELLQLRLVPGRDASLDDLLANAIGGAIGIALARRWRTLVFPAPGASAVLATVAALLSLSLSSATGWMLAPALRGGPWSVHVPTAEGNSPAVLDARLGDLRLVDTVVLDPEGIRNRLLAGERLTARAVIPRATTGEPGVLVLEDEDTEQSLVDFRRAGRGVAFFVRTRTAALRLRMPPVAIRGFLSAGPRAGRDTVLLTGVVGRGVLTFTAERRGLAQTRSVALSPNWGWSFVIPGYTYGPEVHLLTAVWLAALALPIAYWSVRVARGGARGPRFAMLLPLLPAVALLLVPVSFGLPRVHWSEWAGWAGGAALGLALGRGGGALRGLAARLP